MKASATFDNVLDNVMDLSPDEQETLIDILNRRLIEYRRYRLAKDIKNTQKEFEEGKCCSATPDELMREILA